MGTGLNALPGASVFLFYKIKILILTYLSEQLQYQMRSAVLNSCEIPTEKRLFRQHQRPALGLWHSSKLLHGFGFWFLDFFFVPVKETL